MMAAKALHPTHTEPEVDNKKSHMTHSPKLTAYVIRLRPENDKVEATNRTVFSTLGKLEKKAHQTDSFLFLEMFREFIAALDTQSMYSEPRSKKCMTANQPNIEDPTVNPNIHPHSEQYIVEGVVEGGGYGKKRKKTSTLDKSKRSDVEEDDAITSDFYFFIYSPPFSDKSVLFVQSYTDDTIDAVMKSFWQNFYTLPGVFGKPRLERFIPESIIEKFKHNSTVSGMVFTTEVPGRTLHSKTQKRDRKFKVEIKITPTKEDLTVNEYDEIVGPIQDSLFASRLKLGTFISRKGRLRDQITKRTSSFDIANGFEDIRPTILLSKFIDIDGTEQDFDRIRKFCFSLLEEVKAEVYPSHAVQER